MRFDLTGIGSVADAAKTIANKFFPDKMGDKDRAAAELELQELLTRRENVLIEGKKAVLEAELTQGDVYTKRAMPSVIYSGLVFIFIVHVLFPITAFFSGNEMPELGLPEEFWRAWTGICTAWVLGRSAEKRGSKSKITDLIVGGK